MKFRFILGYEVTENRLLLHGSAFLYHRIFVVFVDENDTTKVAIIKLLFKKKIIACGILANEWWVNSL